jgi:Patatin-like phospholipase
MTDAENQVQSCPVTGNGESLLNALPYLYLLRVQLLTCVALATFPAVALWFAPSLLIGVFDVKPVGMIFVALGAALASWTAMITLWQVLLYGPERFHIRPFPAKSQAIKELPGRTLHRVAFLILGVPTIATAAYVSIAGRTSTFPMLMLGALGGCVLAAFVPFAARTLRKQTWSEAKVVTKFLVWLGPGFRENEHAAYAGHYTAFWSFVVCVALYLGIGVAKFFRIGYPPIVPTLAYLLVFTMIFCWGFSAAAFILDRFRIPLLLPLILWASVSAHVHWTDHFFGMYRTKDSAGLPPGLVIRAGKAGSDVIVVAASGGGIKAAAWTTRVLTGLEEDSRKNFPAHPTIFGDSVRLISAVSGGSVGTMYFVSEYDANGGGLPAESGALEDAITESETSSLDDIAWGLVYPDFFRVFLPIFERDDRGVALERALSRELNSGKRQHHLWSPLAEWREGVDKGSRPAVVFNASVVESGERFLLGTTDLAYREGLSSMRDPQFPQFADRDISLVTAARLSASFPYVSPAARPDLDGTQIHVVDGGYTDNYGVATLLNWLDQALQSAGTPVRRVLIIEIRAALPASEPPPLYWRGWPYQTYAPISAMLNVRDTGQLPRNNEERELLIREAGSHGTTIRDAIFTYSPENAPLSWHLSPKDKQDLEAFWSVPGNSPCNDDSRQRVRDFSAGTDTDAPPPSNCPQ